MRKFACLMGLLLMVSFSASAQDSSKIDLFGGYSFIHYKPATNVSGAPTSINLNGGVGSIAYNATSWFAGVGEFGGYYTGNISGNNVPIPGASLTAESFLFGPKVFMRTGKITPFAQFLFGGVHANPSGLGSNVLSTTAFGMAIGGGLDWSVSHHFAVRVGQLEYLMTKFGSTNGIGTGGTGLQNNVRYSAGVVVKF